jgi:predicted enzyme related to lactoylglutathione lyase
MSKAPVRFERSSPILRVADMTRALDYYCHVLGFKNADWGDKDFTCVARDGADIYLCRENQGAGRAWVWLGVEDAEQLEREVTARGAKIRMPLTNFAWALEFHIEDPDGNVLRLGSEPRDESTS